MFGLSKSRERVRRHESRRPVVESLDGRCLLTGLVGSHIGISMIQGGHVGTGMMVQGGQVGISDSRVHYFWGDSNLINRHPS